MTFLSLDELKAARSEVDGRWCEDDAAEDTERVHCSACDAITLAIAHLEAEPVPDPPKLALNVAHKMGLPDYSSAEASLHISAITQQTTDEEIEALVAKGKIAWSIMGPAVTRQVREAAEKKGWG